MQFRHKRSPSPQKKRPSAQVARPVPQPGPIPMPSVAGNPGLRSALGICLGKEIGEVGKNFGKL